MGYLKTAGIAFDQLGMAICGGNEDCTISATTGKYYKKKGTMFWKTMRCIIDTTFYPIDGKGHCKMAYEKDKDEEFREGYKFVLLVLTVVSCLMISVFTWSYFIYVKLRYCNLSYK